MKTVYISGPISLGGTLSDKETEKYIQRFKYAAHVLRRSDFINVIDPTECEKQETWEDYMKIHIQSVCKSDIICLLPEWHLSKGSIFEFSVASQLGIKVRLAHQLGIHYDRD